MSLTRDQLLAALLVLESPGDAENAHVIADKALLSYIDDPEVTAAFGAIKKWYA